MKKNLIILFVILLVITIGGVSYSLLSSEENISLSESEMKDQKKIKIETISSMKTSSSDLAQTYSNYTQKGLAAEELLKEPTLDKKDKAYLLLTQASGLLDGSKNSLEIDKKNDTLESYRILYSLAQDGDAYPSYRGTAFLALKQAAYLSGSEEWFLEAVQKYDPETYSQIEKLETLEKKVLTVKIEYGKRATSLVLSPFNEIELASDLSEYALLEKDSQKKQQALFFAENLYKTWSSRKEQISGYYDGKNLAAARSLEYKTRYLLALSQGTENSSARKELEEFVPGALSTLESASISENPNRARFVSAAFIRVMFASYLYETYGVKKITDIKDTLSPLYTSQKENIPGFIFYLSTHENKPSFNTLKKIASRDEGFKKFLIEIGWKI